MSIISNIYSYFNSSYEGPSVSPVPSSFVDLENNEPDEYGRTPLLLAVQKADTNRVRLLLTRAIDVNKADNYGNTPLSLAALKNHTEIFSLLLTHPEIDWRKPDNEGHNQLSSVKQKISKERFRHLLNLLQKRIINNTLSLPEGNNNSTPIADIIVSYSPHKPWLLPHEYNCGTNS